MTEQDVLSPDRFLQGFFSVNAKGYASCEIVTAVYIKPLFAAL